jgi:hypothetical protein
MNSFATKTTQMKKAGVTAGLSDQRGNSMGA